MDTFADGTVVEWEPKMLVKSKTKKAFSKNVATEMHSGKSTAQALAIAYRMKRDAERKRGK